MATQHPLSPDEADRIAASIRPSWEAEDDGASAASQPVAPMAAQRTRLEGGSGSPGLAAGDLAGAIRDAEVIVARNAAAVPGPLEPIAPQRPEDTIIQGVPAIDVAGTIPDGTLDDGWGTADPPAAAVPAPMAPLAGSVSPKATQVGVGPSEALEDLKATQVMRRSEPPKGQPLGPLESDAEGTNRTKVIEVPAEGTNPTQVLPAIGAEPMHAAHAQPMRPQAVQAVQAQALHPDAARPYAQQPQGPQPAGFSRADDAIDLPVEKGARNIVLVLVGVLGLAGIVGGAVWFVGRNETKTEKPAPVETAKPTATQAAAPAVPPPPPEPAATTTAAAQPSTTAAPEPPKTAEPAPEPPKTATATTTARPPETSKPPTTAKPPTTSKPPSGKPPAKGGVNKDVPF